MPENKDLPAVEWRVSDALVAYEDARTFMETRVGEIRAETASEIVWLLQHPPLYTAGTSANPGDLLDGERFPVFEAGRGGQYTYHGPGQRVAYVMLDLKRHGSDVRAYVHMLEEVMIRALAAFGVTGERREGRVGIWVQRGGGKEDKIGAIGVRVRKWVSFHGLALNVAPDLSHFSGIVPCGIAEHGVTSLQDLGVETSLDEVDRVLRQTFEAVFQRQTQDVE
ncbi:lipoyl(octanoyl) transferase LipB [Magnetovibrio sp.]|uniref:lipoyl(octanoyl) transferase LipB n=1 Tax=Magnetovibrio sp. TaxID=2024836 RepID=UPI002F921442